jgi:hypothetical protein
MDDLRDLLEGKDARTSPTQLIWTVRNLCEALQLALVDGPSEQSDELKRQFARMSAIADSTLLHANALMHWLDQHEKDCATTD